MLQRLFQGPRSSECFQVLACVHVHGTFECCVRVYVRALVDLALLQGQFILTFQNIWLGSRQIGPSIDRGCVSWGYACVSARVCGRVCVGLHVACFVVSVGFSFRF